MSWEIDINESKKRMRHVVLTVKFFDVAVQM